MCLLVTTGQPARAGGEWSSASAETERPPNLLSLCLPLTGDALGVDPQ